MPTKQFQVYDKRTSECETNPEFETYSAPPSYLPPTYTVPQTEPPPAQVHLDVTSVQVPPYLYIDQPVPPVTYVQPQIQTVTTVTVTNTDKEVNSAKRAFAVSFICSLLLVFICPVLSCCPMLYMNRYRRCKHSKIRKYLWLSKIICAMLILLALLVILFVYVPVAGGFTYGIYYLARRAVMDHDDD